MAAKAKSYAASWADDRLDWRLTRFPACMRCGGGAAYFPLSVHEIERRGHAPRRWANRANYLLVCVFCHEGAFAAMPHAEQLAWKFHSDPECYDLDVWLRIKDPTLRAPNRVTQAEVDYFVVKIRLNMR